ncbi:pirin family protein [Photobacterium sp. 1_MG-2023]|uniref:pirin family protein n=1 Tax=Photobacterium sp. 1_MG-2023 TaxID=3062646 RepID=UPI0026E2441C|nr:pirin family protein [Photobacterium sp. 1_MG-2023]MDO6706889.1 pirin family protein [Photobacterium sp. 1_MG-2023]
MSNTFKDAEQPCNSSGACGAIIQILTPKEKDLGGFSVRRLLPTIQQKMVGPWIFFDHMGPAHFPAGEGINVRPHPHIGIATVTYLFDGEILHRDSLGHLQPIKPGDINLMISGRGIVHSERERYDVTAKAHTLHGLQLWLALPVQDEECEPAFHHYPSDTIPALQVKGVPVRVMMGTAYGVTAPVKTFADTLYVEAELQPGQRLTLPMADERALYIAQGQVSAKDSVLPEHSMAIFSPQEGIEIEAAEPSRIAIIGGENIGPRFIEWNFVSSRKERIEQAKEDWRNQQFPVVPGDETEFIPLPE